jgi:ATP-binding cassette subfamily F protein uup
MSVLLTANHLAKTFGAAPLFTDLSFTISANERVAVIGPNGAGKSTLAKILAGIEQPDSGLLSLRTGLKVCYVPQEQQFPKGASVTDVLAQQLAADRVDEVEAAERIRRSLVDAQFSDSDQEAAKLSGGWAKRLAIVCQLVREPELLILDEPTNHLDLEGILWLEAKLRSSRYSCIFVTHDRYLLNDIASRIVEVSRLYRQGTFSITGDYATFLERKANYVATETKEASTLANKLRREEDWLRHGPKARTTKSQSRIDDAYKLRAEYAETLNRLKSSGSAGVDFAKTDRKSKKLLEVENVSKAYGDKKLFSNLSFVLTANQRLGILGPNGSGKSTLMRTLLGQISGDTGSVKKADDLRITYFDQQRDTLDQNATLKQILAPHSDSVVFQDRAIHVVTWAKRFLFRSDQLGQTVQSLSGGERARLQIARLMLQPADVLFLDEPTNDLDIPTLETLEDSLLEFPGAIVLVTHDRYMLDRVSTMLLGLDGTGQHQFFADFAQWQTSTFAKAAAAPNAKQTKIPAATPPPAQAKPSSKRLSYNEQREWDGMEQAIATAEQTLSAKQAQADDPKIATSSVKLHTAMAELAEAQQTVEKLYARWAELEAKLK